MTYSKDSPYPPATIGTDYAARAAFHDRAALAVRAKLQKLYGITDAELTLPAATITNDWVATLNATMHSELNGAYWQSPRHKSMVISGLSPNDSGSCDKLDTIARDIMQRYIEAFHLRRVIAHKREKLIPPENQKYVKAVDPAGPMIDILINHRSNQAEAELAAAGIQPHEAHRLHTKLIGIVRMGCAMSPELISYMNIMPMLGSIDHPDKYAPAQNIDNRLARLKSHWKTERDMLQLHHRDYMSGWGRE